ncbi:MAG: CRTAC1 family protein [Acidobacteriota bacterium]
MISAVPQLLKAQRLVAWSTLALTLLCLPIFGSSVLADEYDDIALDSAFGLDYARVESPADAIFDALKDQPVFTFVEYLGAPIKSRGAPGTALFDFDRDGDLDIYVTNGPGAANSLFSNQLSESGTFRFVDIGVSAGVDATSQDSTGVCFGDLDNDGDEDLIVLGNNQPNLLFENLGDGTFAELGSAPGIGGGDRTSTGCSIADIDSDGLLDLAVANAYTDFTHPLGIVAEPFIFNEHNQLFRNLGELTFEDVSLSSGIQINRGFAPQNTGLAGLTWALAFVDYDQDGDPDLFFADDQGGVRFDGPDGVVRGILHLFENDGTGHFVDVTAERGLARPGGWMGLSFGDLDCDGQLDFFASNFSDYPTLVLFGDAGGPTGVYPSRWFLNRGSEGFIAPDLGAVTGTPFGWGTGFTDIDHDGDSDVVFHGGMDLVFNVDASNPGVLLENQGCLATFERNRDAFASTTDHQRRNVQGVAVGDLNGDGWEDIVSVSNFDAPATAPLIPVPGAQPPFEDASFVPTFVPTDVPLEFSYAGILLDDGTLSVEIHRGGPRSSVQVELLGGAGLISNGQANRNGIGAVVSVRRAGGSAPAKGAAPVVGGSSYASQHSLIKTFGWKNARRGFVEVLWPGGTRNRLYGVRKGDQVLFPEIPCSFDADVSLFEYATCLTRSLDELKGAGVLDELEAARFFASAIIARAESGPDA